MVTEPTTLLMKGADTLSASDEVIADIDLRTASLRDFWANEDVSIVSTSVTDYVISANQMARSANINAIVYEWTWVDYIDGDSTITDRMGFATIHDMTLAPDSDGNYAVVRDSYDEADISGHTSMDFDSVEFSRATAGIDTAPLFSAMTNGESLTPISSGMDAIPMANLPGNATNILASIEYADKYVIHDVATSSSTSYTAYYNTAVYGPPPSSTDCADYVSQCLYAGGLRDSSTSTASGWYHKRDGTMTCSAAWWGVDAFIKYWDDTYATSKTTNGVIPGNPVYYYGSAGASNHIAFCVGYNSAGNPIVNGHTRDVYHQRMNSVYTDTLNFNTTSPFVSTPQWATTLTVPTTLSSGPYLQAGKAEWFKFTPTTTGNRSIYSTGTTDTKAVLYQASKQGSLGGSEGVMYLYEIASNDDGTGTGLNFRIDAYLTKDTTYYFMVRGYSDSTTGNYGLVLQ